MKKKKNINIVNIVLVMVLVIGVSLLLYPTFSEYWNSFRQSRVIAGYSDVVEELNQEEFEELWKAAKNYNKKLAEKSELSILNEKEKQEYERLLDVTKNGIMAYIEIPKINCSLPIYHGTNESVLQVAIGHVDWSSLPVGGENTHCVISGHRGLPSARLFTDLDRMEVGDQFYIIVLGEILAYEVDWIETVLPEEADNLNIIDGGDYATLVTCTPYGINTHRLLVRGHRVEYAAVKKESGGVFNNILNEIDFSKRFYIMVIIVIIGLAVFILTLYMVSRDGKKILRKKENSKN